MKAIVQNAVSRFVGLERYSDSVLEFNRILEVITKSENEEQLRSRMTLDNYIHFKFGFGSHHMWVKQFVNGETKQQVIFVEF